MLVFPTQIWIVYASVSIQVDLDFNTDVVLGKVYAASVGNVDHVACLVGGAVHGKDAGEHHGEGVAGVQQEMHKSSEKDGIGKIHAPFLCVFQV